MNSAMSPYEALCEAVERADGQSGLARICNVTQPAVWKWLQSSKRLPAEHVLPVEKATGVPRYLLRPDIYPVEHLPAPRSIECGPILSQRSTARQSNRRTVLDREHAA